MLSFTRLIDAPRRIDKVSIKKQIEVNKDVGIRRVPVDRHV
jgi:hypothetical protein